ncbi:MBL fold metallo-hydrolase [Terrarubrum flagellatum]|uniref:MBL fold metallo-hydrolase n=1 Tax=Terrirubrum flagellatum TaxID=2895980 RepID=UPI0031454DF2
MSESLIILGCGSSGGVPRVGQGWGACNPDNPRNRRRRCSALLEKQSAEGVTRVLIDTTPDLRDQLLEAEVKSLDAVVMTHDHADHTHGIDDLRPLVMHLRRRIDVHADEPTAVSLRERFNYCFQSAPGSDYPPILNLIDLDREKPVVIEGMGGSLKLAPIRVRHGRTDALGFRINGLAYTPDLNDIYPESLPLLSDLDVWIVDALRISPHPTHFSLEEALSWIERLKPKRAILTNLHTDLDYDHLASMTPADVEPAFDGMRIVM